MRSRVLEIVVIIDAVCRAESLNLTRTRDILPATCRAIELRITRPSHRVQSVAVERSPRMFKRTEEQEWTRFSKALSNREAEETSDAESPEGAEEVKSQESTPSPAATPSTPAVPAPPPIQRSANNDVNVSVSRIAQPSSRASFGGSDVQSVIGPQTSFSGTLRSETAVRILGAVDGEI